MSEMNGATPEESIWLAQLSTMQEALAAIKPSTPPPEEYGKDLPLDDDDLADSEDLFDDLDDGELYYSSDDLDDDTGEINQDWLRRKCTAYCSRHSAYGLRPEELETNLVALLGSGNNSMFDSLLVSMIATATINSEYMLISPSCPSVCR